MRVVVLVSGSGTLLQALLDAAAEQVRPARDFPIEIVAVGADREGIAGLARAERAGVPTFVHKLRDFPDRAAWDQALAQTCATYEADLVIAAGFMKLVGPDFLGQFAGRYLNSHPSLLPSFPGMHAVRDALDHGVHVTGCTLFFADVGVDTGPILAQRAVQVFSDDDEASLHERIKETERSLLIEQVRNLAQRGWTIEGRKVMLP